MKNFNQLSRAEMKNVMGGVAQAKCTFTGPGAAALNAGAHSYDASNARTATTQQAIADSICEADDYCTGVDCPGAV